MFQRNWLRLVKDDLDNVRAPSWAGSVSQPVARTAERLDARVAGSGSCKHGGIPARYVARSMDSPERKAVRMRANCWHGKEDERVEERTEPTIVDPRDARSYASR
jgi:hypothetical protein